MSIDALGMKGLTSALKTSPDNEDAFSEAARQARDAGIRWALPDSDKRSAQQIIDDSPLLRNLGNQSHVKDRLAKRVGDFAHDADAAYRAVQVLEHVEQFDEDGQRLAGHDVGNGRINGFTSHGDAKHGTEAGRLQDFGKYGFSSLQGELHHIDSAGDDSKARAQAEALGINWQRPDGDHRSAADIIDDNAVLQQLGNQSGVRTLLKQRVGDFTRDADAAYRAVQVLRHIEQFDGNGRLIASRHVDDDRINGFTNSGEARHGTEAGRLQDFGKYGFAALHGKMRSPDQVGGDDKARQQAEQAGIQWTLPDGDTRSASQIIDHAPLLKYLGNQSGVKDRLKERVGDFEHDADAAYRATQVLDRIVQYDSDGQVRSGHDVSNHSIDGFTSSDEARHGTEAGRLQDFGKYGFEALVNATAPDQVAAYQDFLEANPDADPTSKQLAQYAALIATHYDEIKRKSGADHYLTPETLTRYKQQNPQISEPLRQALDFWSRPGAFHALETAKSPLRQAADGDLSASDLSHWLDGRAPTDAGSAIDFVTQVAKDDTVAGVDTQQFDGDIFAHPDQYSAKDKAAVLQDLLTAQQLITEGADAGMWKDDYSKVAIANAVRGHPDPKKLLADVNDHIATLEQDSEVVDYLRTHTEKKMTQLLSEDASLGDALEATYKNSIQSGRALDTLWTQKVDDGDASQQSVLAEFVGAAHKFQSALGIDDTAAVQQAVGRSQHTDELEHFYKTSLVSGDRFKTLLEDNSFEAATSEFSAEVSLYNAALDPDFTAEFDQPLHDNFSHIVQENAFKNASFQDLEAVFGINGGDRLDEDKVRSLIDQIREDNPELLTNPDGSVATADQVLTTLRGDWDTLRQGTKSLNELKLLGSDSGAKQAADAGVLHGVSGLFMAGITIAKGVENAGHLSDRQMVDIATGSVQTATLISEGGTKNFQQFLKKLSPGSEDGGDYVKTMTDNAKRFENAAKGIGGVAGVAAGAYAIFDGVQDIRKGNKVSGGFSITAGSVGAMAGLASTIEGGLGVFAPALLRTIPIGLVAGGLGALAAGVAAVALLIPNLIDEVKQEHRSEDFGQVLRGYLTHYGIDGVKNGDYWDIPDDEWPGYDETPAITS